MYGLQEQQYQVHTGVQSKSTIMCIISNIRGKSAIVFKRSEQIGLLTLVALKNNNNIKKKKNIILVMTCTSVFKDEQL